eukprot:CAMPEP_0184487800 /NCGR_PEP_ID=MMETSP0113_2-20130426/10342_1 /TAXON_ID=91329 /ORGANISM="Norrisiella sphaerica, Strain BC52" /LENGTH=163 /DNA_ID=CAMNT_0026870209 /DNA_START=39 /DNA_END=530 /DNA_ORIENTATION=+
MSEQDLTKYVDGKRITALNCDKGTNPASVFLGQGYAKSDTDEQLILVVYFQEKVKIRGVSFCAETKEGLASGPKSVKIFKDSPNLDFEDAEDSVPTQQFELTEENLTKGEKLKIKFTKFQNVNSLTIFIESNQGDEDISALSNITFYGQVIAGTNMSDLKKAG